MAPESDKSRLNSRSRFAFTLIELLVVVAVISLLMAILLPALHKARQITRRLVCQSNLRQIAFGWHMYLDDHDGKFYQDINAQLIYGGWKGNSFPNDDEHRRPLNKYLGLADLPQSETDAKVFHCPADYASAEVSPFIEIGTSYETNILLVGQDQIGIGKFPSIALIDAINAKLKNLNLIRVAKPSRLLLIGDFAWLTQWLPSPYPYGIPWHGRHCYYNMAFLDGHVEFIKIRKGVFVADEYSVLPFKELYGLAHQEQVEEPCPKCD